MTVKVFPVQFDSDGIELTGLTPSIVMLKKLSNSVNITPSAVSEVDNGFYRYSFDASDGVIYVGKADGGVSITNPNRFKYIREDISAVTEENLQTNEIFIMPVFDQDADTVTFFVYLHRNGQIITADITNVTVEMFDSSHSSQFSINSASNTNGVTILAKATPGIVAGDADYIKVDMVVDGTTYTSIELFKVLE